MDKKKALPISVPKSEIKIKENPKTKAMKNAPDEVIAMAIRDAILKDHEKPVCKKSPDRKL